MSITWTEGSPGSKSDMSAGAQAVRDLKVAIADGVEPSMYWPGSGGGSAASAGVMRLGTFRTYYAAASNVSLGADTGRVFYASDTSRVYVIQPSVDSLPVLSGYAPEHPRSVASTARWVISSGTLASGSVTTFPSAYGAVPMVWTNMYQLAGTTTVESLSATSFLASMHTSDGTNWSRGTDHWVEWISLGTVGW